MDQPGSPLVADPGNVGRGGSIDGVGFLRVLLAVVDAGQGGAVDHGIKFQGPEMIGDLCRATGGPGLAGPTR